MRSVSPMAEIKPAHLVVDDLFEDNFPLWLPKYTAMDELRRFLGGDRYVNDNGEFNRDRRGVQIRGQDIQDTIRHVVAKSTEKPRSVEGRPRDHDSDPDLAEVMVGLVTDELSNPYKGFERERYAAIQTCREMRLGVVWMDLVPNFGPFGSEIFYSWQAPDRIMWEAPHHPHHPLCGWLIRDKRIDVDQARSMYKAPWLEPDKTSFGGKGMWRSGIPMIQGYTDRVAQVAVKDNKITLRECWYKNDQTTKDAGYSRSDVLKPGDRYLSCASGCGYRSDTQDTLKKMGAIQKALPEMLPQACPTCAGDMHRIDAKDTSENVLAYSRGRRLVLTAPFSPNPNNVPVADDSWPVSRARSFPALFQFASVKPGDVMGPCDVDWMWDQQVAQDNLDTMAVQRVFEHRTITVMPEVGINDFRRKRFEMRNDQQNIAFRDHTKSKYGELKIEQFSTVGLDPNWGAVRQVVNTNLTRYVPKGDIGLTEGDSKNIPVGTVELVQQQGEVATNDFIRRCNQELSMFYGVVEDYICATYTPERISRLNIDGADILLSLSGQDLPNFDYVVAETPEFTGIDKEKSQAFDSAMQIASTMGPEALDAWGQFHNVPRSVIRSIQKLFADKAAEAQAAMEAGAAPGGMDAAGMDPGAVNDGQSASGIPPQAMTA